MPDCGQTVLAIEAIVRARSYRMPFTRGDSSSAISTATVHERGEVPRAEARGVHTLVIARNFTRSDIFSMGNALSNAHLRRPRATLTKTSAKLCRSTTNNIIS